MKRILAIVASRLACELARQKLQGKKAEAGKRPKPAPLAVILEREGGGASVLETATIDVIDQPFSDHQMLKIDINLNGGA